ncbi:MAG: RNA 2',3'-cyclic phosphodiesterase [Syntrophomonadales bacterium]|jgi:2'-5' RNA ligase
MRLFFAIDIPPEIKPQVIAARNQLARGVRGIKWVEDHNLHLTMKFLGEVPDGQVKDITDTVRRTLVRYPGFRLEVGSPGFFPNNKNPRVIWLEIKGNTKSALGIGRAIDDSLLPFGFDEEKRRQLHLTLGRVRSDNSVEDLLRNARGFTGFASKPDFEVHQLVLYRSQLTNRGPFYTPVEKFVLNG